MALRKTKKPWIYLTIFFTILLSLYTFFKKTPADIFWGDGYGTHQMFDIFFHETRTPHIRDIENPGKNFRLAGILNLRILDSNGSKKAALQMSRVSAFLNGKEYSKLNKIYSSMFLVEFNENGAIKSIQFDNDIADEDERDISSIIKMLQFTVKKSITSAWTSKEKGTLGFYNAEYIFDNNAITKKKLNYISILDKDGFPEKNRTAAIRDSLLTVIYGEPYTWIKTAAGRDKISILQGDQSYSTIDTVIKIKRIKYNPDKKLLIWRYSGTFDDLILSWNTKPKNTVSFADSLKIYEFTSKYGSASVNALTNSLFSYNKPCNKKAIRELTELLIAIPEEALNIPRLLLTNHFGNRQKEMLIDSLKFSSHPQAQNALCTIMTGTRYRARTRSHAAASLGHIEKATPVTLEKLWQVYYDYKDNTPSSAKVSNSAILSLGMISNMLSHSNNEKDHEEAEEIRDKIVYELKSAQIPGRISILLKATGKTGHEDTLDVIEEYLKSEAPFIRSSAVLSLLFFENPKADEMLIERLHEEKSSAVKKTIITTISERRPSEQTVMDILNHLPNEKDASIRGLMYQYIRKGQDIPGAKKELQKILEKEKNTQNKKIINSILNTRL